MRLLIVLSLMWLGGAFFEDLEMPVDKEPKIVVEQLGLQWEIQNECEEDQSE